MTEMDYIDLEISGGTIFTMDPEQSVIENGKILIHDDRIVSITTGDHSSPETEVRERLSGEGKLILPGLINAHSHLAMTLFRGFVEDLVLQDWLEKVWEYELTSLDARAVRAGSKLAFAEMIKAGVTCAHDMYWHYQETMQLAEEIGFRLISGPPITRLGDPDFEELFQEARNTLEWVQELDFVSAVLQTHSTYTTTGEMMKVVRELISEYGVCFTTHASENQAEVESVREMYQKSPLAVLDDFDLLGPFTILAHCVMVDGGEIERLSETGTHVAHCPESNLKLGSGIAPVAEMISAGVNVCLGTDGPASNNDLNLLGELKTAALLQKGVHNDPELLPTRQALELVTRNGARAYGLEDEIGSLETGKKADLIMIDLDKIHFTPPHDLAANLIYGSGKSDVNTVIIDGQIQLLDGKLTRLDEQEIKAEIQSIDNLFG